MEQEWGAAVVGGLAVLAAALIGARLIRRHERQQLARQVRLEPAERFAQASVKALALLRYVTPPEPPTEGVPPHRNEPLLNDANELQERMLRCAVAIDGVRSARAHVRIVFQPDSAAAEHSRRVQGGIRKCLEKAEEYYWRHDQALTQGPSEGWRADGGARLRAEYKQLRTTAYANLDGFYREVASQLMRPTWNTIDPAEVDPLYADR